MSTLKLKDPRTIKKSIKFTQFEWEQVYKVCKKKKQTFSDMAREKILKSNCNEN
jgi:hypothetical protein